MTSPIWAPTTRPVSTIRTTARRWAAPASKATPRSVSACSAAAPGSPWRPTRSTGSAAPWPTLLPRRPPGQRSYDGNAIIDEVEDLARARATELFGAEHANVPPRSGANANMAVYLGLLEPGDAVLALNLDHGGHLTHGSPANATGKLWNFVHYKVTPSDERLDFDQI